MVEAFSISAANLDTEMARCLLCCILLTLSHADLAGHRNVHRSPRRARRNSHLLYLIFLVFGTDGTCWPRYGFDILEQRFGFFDISPYQGG